MSNPCTRSLAGHYEYTTDLLCLNFYRSAPPAVIDTRLQAVTTPLALLVWVHQLAAHPDLAFARYICKGIQEGFRIDFQ